MNTCPKLYLRLVLDERKAKKSLSEGRAKKCKELGERYIFSNNKTRVSSKTVPRYKPRVFTGPGRQILSALCQ